jgi:Tfp pilus assembly protein PilN
MSEYQPVVAPPPLSPEAARIGRSGRRPVNASAERQAARTATPVLGVHVTPDTLFGVLLRPTGDGFEPIRQFSRRRSAAGGDATPSAPELAAIGGTPDLAAPVDDGVTLRIGEGAGATDLFLDSEFTGLAAGATGGLPAGFSEPSLRPAPAPIVFELKDMIEECRQAGYERPGLSFCIGAPDVDYLEIVVADDASGKRGRKGNDSTGEGVGAPVKRDRLVSLLPKADIPYERDRVAFVPMTPREGHRRYLAVLPRPEEPVAQSLRLLREQSGMRRLSFRAIDAEVPVLLGLTRLALPSDPHETTALVRVGAEDTLVMLMVGNQLHHCEHMRSVTTFDGPDTICSRVLLQQDVQGIGTVHHVVILADEREEELAQGFAAFYPDARVETLRDGLARVGIAGPHGPLATAALPAAGVALKALLRKDAVFEDTNLLPKSLRKVQVGPRMEVAFAWHTLVIGVLLFLSVLFFMGLYLAQQRQIAEAERRLAELPTQSELSGPRLQARIDSLRNAKQQIDTSLRVLDSLLVGSDRWTQTLARTTRAASATGGVWFEDWSPSDSGLAVRGYATGRDRVVGLAERLGASIEEVTFQAIREAPVYQYRLRMRIPNELPQVAQHLRERARADAAAAVAAGAPAEPLESQVPLPAGTAPPRRPADRPAAAPAR